MSDAGPEADPLDALDSDPASPTGLRRLASHITLNRWTFSIAFATLLVLTGSVMWSAHLGSFLDGHSIAWWLLVVAGIVSVGQYVGYGISLMGASTKPLPAGRTLELQVAESLTSMATPESIGSLALTMRFLTKQGLGAAEAAAVDGLSSFLTTFVGVILVPLGAIFAASSLDVAALKKDVPSGQWELIVAVVVLAGFITAAIKFPRLRRRIHTFGGTIAGYLRQILAHPTRGLTIGAGELLTASAQVATMAFVLAALGAPINIAAILVITQIASAASNVVPIPGGLGAPEAILIAGLSSVGVGHTEALLAALIWRYLTYWLPPIPGAILLYDLRKHRLI